MDLRTPNVGEARPLKFGSLFVWPLRFLIGPFGVAYLVDFFTDSDLAIKNGTNPDPT